jgi:hypothetical protein
MGAIIILGPVLGEAEFAFLPRAADERREKWCQEVRRDKPACSRG